MLVFPNSAPDSLTPKYLNKVRDPEQTEELGAGADDVVDGGVEGVVEGGATGVLEGGDEVLTPGRHW